MESTTCTVLPKEIVLSSHFCFCFSLCAMQCCLFLSVSQWHGLSANYSTNSKSVNVNLVQSLAINLPHTLRCNLEFTIIVIRTLAIVYIRTSLQSTQLYWQHDQAIWLSYPYTMTQGLVILMALKGSLMQIFTFERWTKDLEQETGFCR